MDQEQLKRNFELVSDLQIYGHAIDCSCNDCYTYHFNQKRQEMTNDIQVSKNQEVERLKSYFTGMRDGVSIYLPRIIKAVQSREITNSNKRSLLREINSEINKLRDKFLEQRGE